MYQGILELPKLLLLTNVQVPAGMYSRYHTIIHTTGGVKPSRERAFNLCMENDGWLPAAGNLPKFSWGVSDFVEFFCPCARTKGVKKGFYLLMDIK
jgi:hypothetical protein